jgi:hypothetical protein
MGKNVFTNLAESILTNNGQAFHRAPGNSTPRIIYPAIVREIADSAGYNRIKAEIINLNEDGEIYSGKDKNLTFSQLPICIPLLPEFMHVRPQLGETVLLIMDNPQDPNSVRYWIGPIINQQTNLKFQSFQSAQAIYNRSSLTGKQIGGQPSTENDNDAGILFAKQDEIAFQGRKNSDLILGDNEVKLRTGIFNNLLEFKENTDYPCQIELKIVEKPIATSGVRLADAELNATFEPFSQQNIKASNINLISPEGKFRKISTATAELAYNPRLNDFGEEAKTLHPAVLGDELVNILYLIISYMFSHIHTPQNPPLPNNFAFELQRFRNKNFLSAQILSNHVRLN